MTKDVNERQSKARADQKGGWLGLFFLVGLVLVIASYCAPREAAPKKGGEVTQAPGPDFHEIAVQKTVAEPTLSCLPTYLRNSQEVRDYSGALPLCENGSPSNASSAFGYITKTQVEATGDRWPLSVEGGFVGCSGAEERWFEADGTRYGVNGMATEKRGYADITPIWLLDAQFNDEVTRMSGMPPKTPFRISIGPLTSAAGRLCS